MYSGSTELTLSGAGTVAGSKLGAIGTSQHVVIRHPATINVSLVVPAPTCAGKLNLSFTAIDYDINKVTRTAPVSR